MAANPLYLFFHTPPNFGPLFLRLALATLFFYQGAQKVFGWFGGEGWNETIVSWTGAYETNIGTAVIVTIMVSELIISVLFLFGFLTRLASFVAILIIGGALYYVYGGTGFDEVQLPIMILASALALLFMGGGHLSIDRFIGTNLLPYVG